jgi:hypothetical protein
VEEAQVILHDCGKQHVHNLLDEGKLSGVDLRGRGLEKRLPRLWRHSVLHQALRPDAPLQSVPVADLLPHRRPTIYRGELARWFGCAENTVAAWMLAGPRTDTRSVYHRAAVIEFLEERAL